MAPRARILASIFSVFVASGVLAVSACGGDDGSNAGASSGGTSSGFVNGDAGPADDAPPPTCLDQQAPAVEGSRPVDIIFAIDNSDSMAARIAAVEDQINQNFANIIAASGLDYRVIMLSKHGKHVDPVDPVDPLQRICVRSPLSGTTCDPIPKKPVETAHFIQHDIIINSTDSWCQILTSFTSPDSNGDHPQGWSAFLRPEAFKTFIVISDDQISAVCNPFNSPTPLKFDDLAKDLVQGANTAGSFDSALLALSPTQFGTANARNYVWHSIVGLAPFDANDLTKAWPPSAPMTLDQCTPSSVQPGTGYQALSKLTGGLRYPICGNDFTTIFQAVATDVIKRSHVACEFTIPTSGDGGAIDPATAVVAYTASSTNTTTNFAQVKDLASCGNDKFYIEGDRIKLCPTACGKVSTDPNAQIKILFGCLPKGTN